MALPEPRVDDRMIDRIHESLHRFYPEFSGFRSGPFVDEERDYKLEASKFAQEQLNRSVYEDLLREKNYEELARRLKAVAAKTNLLWLRVKVQGDLAALETAGERLPDLLEELGHLLHGSTEEPLADRVTRWSRWLADSGLPDKWTFPTYFLFLLRPRLHLFVKPQATTRFVQWLGFDVQFYGAMDAERYQWLLNLAQALAQRLPKRFDSTESLDMIDIHSILWIVYADLVEQDKVEQDKAEKDKAEKDEVEQAKKDAPDPEPVVDPGPLPAPEPDEGSAGDGDEPGPVIDPPGPKPIAPPPTENPPDPLELQDERPLSAIAGESHLPLDRLERWVRAVERKGQAILYGPPGTGKTFLAKRLAEHLVGGGRGFVELVQFHPSYGYEDFIQGIRPVTVRDSVGYELVPGRFLELCTRAERREKDELCVLIIDEINRAHLARVFGELMYLLEYRDESRPLAGGRRLRVPPNLRILGTMNTADRSVALVDHALRRRFAFLSLVPSYTALERHLQSVPGVDGAALVDALRQINDTIGDPHYAVGISHFFTPRLADELEDIWRMEIEPYLEEYFYDRREAITPLRWSAVAESLRPENPASDAEDEPASGAGTAQP